MTKDEEKEVLELAELRGAQQSIELHEIYDGTADNPPIGCITTYGFEEVQLLDFAAAIRAPLEAQIERLHEVLSLIEPSGDFSGWEDAGGHEIGKKINALISSTQPTADAFVARIKSEAFEQAHATIEEQAKLIRVLKGALSVAVTDEMVSRFLVWRLPPDFAPDCGISFTPIHDAQPNGVTGGWPVGTNLFTAEQARAMLEYVLADEVDDPHKGKE